MMLPATMSSAGMETARIQLSPTSCRTAMMMPPIAIIGAITSMVALIIASICTCCTSFVLRVMSEPAPKCDTSRSLKPETLEKMSPRRSRPRLIAARAAQNVATMAARICPSATSSMNMPVRKM